MKAKSLTYLMLVGVTAGMIACSKEDSNSAPAPEELGNTEITLVNDTSGSDLAAGSVKITELADGNASLQLSLDTAFRDSALSYPAAIVAYDTTLQRDSVYANLGLVDGTTGMVTVNPIIWGPTNQPITYDSLLSLTGYRVRVGVDSLVEAEGTIQ
ncbi:hypothetical protein [Flavihumibacter petaseus]|uniref:Uncharacterized protein n=1 Tax=Flavihumibacter petaseus NBRC 106054 TaxID=1220578 RepID=A0A0E9MVL6_9BACT|nr:hypothetical protein [Flavihumibacter petaseus]GAO41528.1 hypothetical protein FPE01S_01_05420 [Flavihumibacter petaseus NBRC 106054]